MGAKGKFALAYVGASAMLLAGIAIAWVAFWNTLLTSGLASAWGTWHCWQK